MTTPTADSGAPTASTASSIAGDSIFARPHDREKRDHEQAEAEAASSSVMAAHRAPPMRQDWLDGET